MGNKPPEGSVEVKHIFNPKLKKNKLFLLKSNEQIGKGQVPVVRATLFLDSGAKIPCCAKTILKSDPEGAVLLDLFAKFEQSKRLEYPQGVVLIHGMAEDANVYTIIMEQMKASLYDVLYHSKYEELRTAWKDEERERIALGCLLSVMDLHTLGVIHRDIKPANFLVNDSMTEVKLCDLGSIKQAAGTTTHNLRQFGGTVPYMSPERMTEDEDFKLTADGWKASDLYSVGIVMCEILGGAKPFLHVAADQLIEQRMKNHALKPFEKDEQVLSSMYHVCNHTMLCKDASQRTSEAVLKAELFASTLFMQGCEQLFKAKNEMFGIALFTMAANKRQIFATNLLSYYYRTGKHVKRDEVLAFQYSQALDRAAPASTKLLIWTMSFNKHEEIELLIARCYLSGWGCEKDEKKALSLLEKHASKGNAFAQNMLGACLQTAKKEKQALQWYEKAANQNFAQAQYNLGWCYHKGFGTKKNVETAVYYYTKAAAQQNAHAQLFLGMCLKQGKGTTQDTKQAIELISKSASQGYSQAQNSLAVCYQHAEGVEKDIDLAFKLFTKAALLDNEIAQCNLAKCYHHGIGTNVDLLKAKHWYQQSADKGNKAAMKELKALGK